MKKTIFCSGKDAKRGVLLEGGEEAGEMDATSAYYRHNVARKYAKFFQSTLHHNNGYFAQVCLSLSPAQHHTHCLLVLPRQSIYHQPPIHHRIFFLSAFNCVKVTLLSNPATISLNQLCAYQPTHCTIGWFHQILEGSLSGLL